MGVQMGVQQGKNAEYFSALQRFGEIAMERTFSPWLFADALFALSALGREQARCVRVLHALSRSVIARRHQQLLAAPAAPAPAPTDEFGRRRERLDFLELLLRRHLDVGDLTLEEVREEVDTFLFEGHDTTAAALAFCLWLLSRHPLCQERVWQEQVEVLGAEAAAREGQEEEEEEEGCSAEALGRMKYLECVIKESLRLFPSVPVFMRELQQEASLGEGLVAPAGTAIILAPFFQHRHPRHFERPEEFDPLRFADAGAGAGAAPRHPFAYVPFSAGPRNCIGQKFAMLEMKAVVGKVVRRFRLLPAQQRPHQRLDLALEIILRSTGGVHVRLEERR